MKRGERLVCEYNAEAFANAGVTIIATAKLKSQCVNGNAEAKFVAGGVVGACISGKFEAGKCGISIGAAAGLAFVVGGCAKAEFDLDWCCAAEAAKHNMEEIKEKVKRWFWGRGKDNDDDMEAMIHCYVNDYCSDQPDLVRDLCDAKWCTADHLNICKRHWQKVGKKESSREKSNPDACVAEFEKLSPEEKEAKVQLDAFCRDDEKCKGENAEDEQVRNVCC